MSSTTLDQASVINSDKAKAGQTADGLLLRLPDEVVDILTEEQKERLTRVHVDDAWRRHPVDVRMSVPWFGKRFYMTVIAGEEKRGRGRRDLDKSKYPVHTIGNLFFFLGIATLFYLIAIFGMFFYSGVLR